MILRRVIAHFRKQEWTAIAIDFVIVVAGVFVGLQVSNWNAASRDRALERGYMERLADDLSEDIRRIDWMIGIYETKQRVLRILRDEPAANAMKGDPQEAARNLDYTEWKGLPGPRRAIYDELLGSGNLTLLRDVELRNALADYYSQYAGTAALLQEPIGGYMRLFTETIPGDIPVENLQNADAATVARIIAALETMKADPGFEKAVNSEMYYGRDLTNWLNIHRDQATALLAMLNEGGASVRKGRTP